MPLVRQGSDPAYIRSLSGSLFEPPRSRTMNFPTTPFMFHFSATTMTSSKPIQRTPPFTIQIHTEQSLTWILYQVAILDFVFLPCFLSFIFYWSTIKGGFPDWIARRKS